MEGKSSGSGSGIPLNPTTILAVLTLMGSVLLVSHKLSSDRPVASAGSSRGTIGDQLVDTRLWEDPFPSLDAATPNLRATGLTELTVLQSLIEERRGTNSDLLLLPVMVSGGPYSEDRESRIRRRFAVVSALGQRGYAPSDAEHIGAIELPWPATADLASGQSSAASYQQLITQARGANLRMSYEWYRQRTFGPDTLARWEWVLVLWLDENQFDDLPLLRLALLLQPLLKGPSPSPTGEVAMIGPGRSETLRAMLPGEFAGKRPEASVNPSLWVETTNLLQRVNLFSPTASAMDEVLVNTTNHNLPRAAVLTRLTNGLFKAAWNFSVTDSQLAEEIFDELSLRGVNMTNSSNHLVLISEWDSFYGRTLSLTYASQLAQLAGDSPSRARFVDDYRHNRARWPTNLHSYVYLRGLDGQTTAKDADNSAASDSSPERSGASGEPNSLQVLRRWTPEANKPEGRAQFDYLERLGDRLSRLDHELGRENRGSIRAIGIVGSDRYDTLLILQALRGRFTSAVFFTTDLDARFWDHSEWQWARNLVIVSSYGLQLHPNLQAEVPPFRDSLQTSVFAAALAALGNEHLLALPELRARRFEIGRFGPIDLSLTNPATLHPVPPGMRGGSQNGTRFTVPCLLGLLFAIGFATLIFRPWIRLTRERRQYEAESLWIREEDIGGLEGFRAIQKHLHEANDPLIKWLVRELSNWPIQQGSTELWSGRAEVASEPGLGHELTVALQDEDQMQRFLDFLNENLKKNQWVPVPVLEASQILQPQTKMEYGVWLSASERQNTKVEGNTLLALQHNRRMADDLLDWILRADVPVSESKTARKITSRADAAASARRAGWQKHRLRHARLEGFWISVAVFLPAAIALALSSWRDTYDNTRGEPFSITAGTSSWPTECLRFAALALTLAFVAESYALLRSTVLDLTRKYRLQFARTIGPPSWWLATTPVPEAVVQADQLWERYQQMGLWKNRCRRILLPLLAYIGFGICLSRLSSSPYRPLRGHTIFIWDNGLLTFSVLSFLFLTFWSMDSARLCRWFIEHLSEAPSRYPKATREFFSSIRGGTPAHLLDEWIDLQLIAELTERVGRLIYFPFIVFFLLLLSRNQWFDLWPWSGSLIVIFSLNLALAAGGLIILQRSAKRSRVKAVVRLQTKLDRLREAVAVTEPQKAQKALGQAEKLLDEIQELDTGAFAGFWQNPLVGALLVPSGGTAIIELIHYFIAR